jgi:ribosomal protein S18 acetylase RimI-like enzyme
VITFDKYRCGDFAASILKSDKQWGDWFQAIGLERDGKIEAVAIYNGLTDHDVEMTVAAVSGRKWASRSLLKAAFQYPFVQLGIDRVTAHIRESNTPALFAAERAGFKIEGRARKWFGNEDAIMFGMLKSECRYL